MPAASHSPRTRNAVKGAAAGGGTTPGGIGVSGLKKEKDVSLSSSPSSLSSSPFSSSPLSSSPFSSSGLLSSSPVPSLSLTSLMSPPVPSSSASSLSVSSSISSCTCSSPRSPRITTTSCPFCSTVSGISPSPSPPPSSQSFSSSKREILFDIIRNSELRSRFQHFLEEIYSVENLTFLIELQAFKSIPVNSSSNHPPRTSSFSSSSSFSPSSYSASSPSFKNEQEGIGHCSSLTSVIDLNNDMSNTGGGTHQVSFSPITAHSADRKDKLKQARKIFDEYLDEDGNSVLPVGTALKKQIQEQLESQEFDDNLFDLVALEVLQIVETDLVPKFLQSPSYISYQQQHTVQQQQQQQPPPINTTTTSSSSSASSFFSFITPRRKTSSTSSSSPSFSTTSSSSSTSATVPITATSTSSSSFNLLTLLTSLSNSSTANHNSNSNVVNVTNPLYNSGGAHSEELESSPRDPPTPSSSSSSVSQFTLNLNSTSNFSSGSSSITLGSTPTSYTSTPRKFSFSSSKASVDAKSTKEHKKKEKKEKKEKKSKRHHRKGKEGGTEEDSSQQDSQYEGPDRRELVGATIVELLGEPGFELAYILCEATLKSQPSACSFGSPRSSSPPVSANNSSEDLMTGDAIEAILDLADTKCFAEDLIKQRLKLELRDLNRSPRQDGWLTVFREESVFTKLISKYFMLKGSNFMAVNVITPFVTTIAELGSLEIDLGDVEPSPTATANAEKLIQLATDFFITLCTTIPRFPAEIRRLCHAARSALLDVCADRPELIRRVLGNLFFLRFVCPCLVLTQRDISGRLLSRTSRRTLVLISKMIQNLVLGVEFDGTKEKFMIPLNPFITSHRAAIESFLQQITSEIPDVSIQVPRGDHSLFSSEVIRIFMLRNQDYIWDQLTQPTTLHLLKRMKLFFFCGLDL